LSADFRPEGELRKSVLPNGMKVVTETIPYVRSVAVGFAIEGGSRIEPEPLNGATHFIEHMLFKGTDKRSAKDIAMEIDFIGGHLDAFTSREYTCFFANCLDENLSAAIELLIDILLNPTFPPEEIERERGVILEEIRSIEDSPDDYVHDMLTQNFWGDHPLGRPIIGPRSIISSLDRDELNGYYRKTYQPQRIIFAAAGNLSHEQILDMVGNAIPKPGEPYIFPSQSFPSITPHFSLKEKELEQVHICLGTAGLSQIDEARHAGYLLNTILGGGLSSRLFQTIREERGLAYAIYSYWSPLRDTGMLLVYAGTKKESAREVIELVLSEFKKMKMDAVTGEELKRAKNQVKGSIMLGLESTANRMSKLVKQEMYFGRFFTLNETIEAIDQVKEEDIMSIANKIMDTSYLNLSTIGPLNGISLTDGSLTC
jgi:predicted Zn-dependent peptidase